MKAKELMVGDWVKINDHYDQVREIRFNGVYCEFTDGLVNFCDVNPIPVTEDILRANGFGDDGKMFVNLVRFFEEEKVCVTTSDDARFSESDSSWWVDFDNESFVSTACFEVTYVLQFQHAMRLCGIETELAMQ